MKKGVEMTDANIIFFDFRFGSTLEDWLASMEMCNACANARSVLCSRHFDPSDIKDSETPGCRAVLVKGALPKYFRLKRKNEVPNLMDIPKKKCIRLEVMLYIFE